jgi:hypothetical protein
MRLAQAVNAAAEQLDATDARSVVVLAGEARVRDRSARALAEALEK